MRKRLRKKLWKKKAEKWELLTGEDRTRCENCGKRLCWDNKYHRTWGTCDAYCYGVLVGVYYDTGIRSEW